MGGMLENSNPAVFGRVSERKVLPEEEDDDIRDEIDAREVFDIFLRCVYLRKLLRIVGKVCIHFGPWSVRSSVISVLGRICTSISVLGHFGPKDRRPK